MARDFARAFYHSKVWKQTREAYFRSRRGLCERCASRGMVVPGEIVHHVVHLTPENISDPAVTLDFGNLELVCRACHAEEHPEIYERDGGTACRVVFDENGDVHERFR